MQETIETLLASGTDGKLLEVMDEEDGEIIYIE